MPRRSAKSTAVSFGTLSLPSVSPTVPKVCHDDEERGVKESSALWRDISRAVALGHLKPSGSANKANKLQGLGV